MTKFGTVFKQMFLQKSRSAYWIFGIQFFAAFILAIFTSFSGIDKNPQIDNTQVNVIAASILFFIAIFLMLSFFTSPIYLLYTSWKNEKINRNQTYHLIPISSEKLYVSNTLSSLAAYLYLEILELIVMLVGFFGVYASSSDVRKGITQVISDVYSKNSTDLGILFEYLIIGILISLFWYVMISFYHFVSRSVIDFLPATSNHLLIFLIRVAVLFFVIYALYFLSISVGGYFIHPLSEMVNYGQFKKLLTVILVFIIFDGIFGGLNIFLIDKFVEAKHDK